VRSLRVFAALLLIVALAACTNANSPTGTVAEPSTRPSTESEASRAPKPSERPPIDPASFDPKNPVVPGFVPRTVLFLDDEHGVIGGRIECPKRCEGNHDGILAVTGDAGSTWRLTERTDTPITNLASVPATGTVFATSSQCAYFFSGCGRSLLRSSDGGASWVSRASWVVNPSFATPTLGFGSGTDVRDGLHPQTSAITRDGGRTWKTQLGPCHGEQNMTVGFSFPSSELGWAACASSEAGAGFFQFKAVYRTTDGGATWTPTDSSSPSHAFGRGLWANGGALGIHMFTDGSGYFWAGGGYAYLVHTSDGGHTWRTVWKDGSGGGREISDISWLDTTHAYAVRWDSSFGWTLARTVDGGHHWLTLTRWPSKE
jgi:photosystem II stability/assembly factor-like uncharacterized protein